MKVLAFLLCLLTVSQARVEPEPMTGNNVVDFITGLMEGLNEGGDIKKLIECIKDADKLIEDIINALKLIETKEIDQIIIGVTKLVKAVKTLFEMFEPCAEGFEQLKKLMKALKNLNLEKLIVKVISNLDKIITLVKNCVKFFKEKNFKEAGKSLGALLLLLFLSNTPPAVESEFEKIFLAIKAFVHGVNKGGQLNNTDECVGQVLPALEAIKKIFEGLKWNSLQDFINSFNAILDACEHLLRALSPCYEIVADFKTIFEIIKKIDANKIMNKLLLNFSYIIATITTVTAYINEGNYEGAGKELGELTYYLILE